MTTAVVFQSHCDDKLVSLQDKIASLKIQLTAKEKAVERQRRRINELKAELQADRKDREERDKRVEASQEEIKQMLIKLLSKD